MAPVAMTRQKWGSITMIEVNERVTELAQIKFYNFGGAPMAEHNMPCPKCVKRPAVMMLTLNKHRPAFQPCWTCQGQGWVIVNIKGWRRLLLRCLGLLRF